jgi:MtfA peptidase
MWLLKFFSAAIILFNAGNIYGSVVFLITGNYLDKYRVPKKHRLDLNRLEPFLDERFVYFKSLSEKARKKFMARLCKVLLHAEFTGKQTIQINLDMKICIVFSMVQLTFGLRNFHLIRFRKFVIYPDTFYSRFFEKDLKGMTSGLGFIALSWPDFEHGYLVHNDKFNLGLHEMAHALRIELNARFGFFNRVSWLNNQMSKQALNELHLVSRGVPSVLRDYAHTNAEEFFAVCVEYFFEAPELLRSRKPEIYQLLCRMLNQNPLNRDYKPD